MIRALVLSVVVACGGPPAASSTFANHATAYDPVVELQQIKTALCACHQVMPEGDDTCYGKIAEHFNAWAAANKAWFAALPEPAHTNIQSSIDDARSCFQALEGDPVPPGYWAKQRAEQPSAQ